MGISPTGSPAGISVLGSSVLGSSVLGILVLGSSVMGISVLGISVLGISSRTGCCSAGGGISSASISHREIGVHKWVAAFPAVSCRGGFSKAPPAQSAR
eukprot:4391629-Alexandrium_andersonii.AAC.1